MSQENDLEEDDYGPTLPGVEEKGQKREAEASPKKVLEEEEVKKPKKPKLAEFPDSPFPESLPFAESYERSYMHRDLVTHVVASHRCDFALTASSDGVVKFWRRTTQQEDDASATTGGVTGMTTCLVEFIKQYKAHMCPVADLVVSNDGELALTIGADDGLVNLFDVPSFDLINRLKLGFQPQCASFLTSSSTVDSSQTMVALSEGSKIVICDARGTSAGQQHILRTLDTIHRSPITLIRFNAHFGSAVSCDEAGFIEMWAGPRYDFARHPPSLKWQYKTDTDLYEIAKAKTQVLTMAFSPRDGKIMAILGRDRLIRLFDFPTGKILVTIDESLDRYRSSVEVTADGDEKSVSAERLALKAINSMELGRRLAVERDIDAIPLNHLTTRYSIVFDEAGHYLFYPSLLGIHVVDISQIRTLKRVKCVRVLGRQENLRFLSIGILQGVPLRRGLAAALTLEQHASANPALEAATAATASLSSRPILFASALRRNRFYLISRKEAPEDERDIFNEKPTREDALVGGSLAVGGATGAGKDGGAARLASSATLHTSFGDIQFELFGRECPKTVENFTALARSGYYDGHIFHRVIRGFMIQTGDPTGTGAGGQSIWGRDFEDEILPSVKHDRPFTVSMANAGPNTNGSQFFITVVPAPWLDGKHTVFGRLIKGMDIALRISNVKRNPKTDKPLEDIRIVGVTLR